MQQRILTEDLIESYTEALQARYSKSTKERYLRDVMNFYRYTQGREVNREVCMQYENELKSKYSAGSVHTILSGLNRFFVFAGWDEMKICIPKLQPVEGLCRMRLTLKEYQRLLIEAERMGDRRLSLLMQTLCTLQLKVSEHPLITREVLEQGYFVLSRKGSRRILYVPPGLKMKLIKYCQQEQIVNGPVFRTTNGGIYHRSNIHKDMKQLCQRAQVEAYKVTPQQLLNLSVSEPVVQIMLGDKNVI